MAIEKKIQFRQGDVLVEKTQRVSGEAQKPEGERVVLAHGEMTGHAHAISAKDARLFVAGVIRKIKVHRATRLQHEEHGAISLDKGSYQVIRQREYTPQEIQNVAD